MKIGNFLVIMAISVVITVKAGAQSTTTSGNGGQFWENGSVKIEYGGQVEGKKCWIKVWSKQGCQSDFKVVYGDITKTLENVWPFTYDTIHVVVPLDLKIKAKALTNCGSTDFGWVELLLPTVLPTTFTNIKVILSHSKLKQ